MLKSTFIIIVMVLTASPVQAESLSGPATVIDGKTIEITGQRLQLFGIETPHLKQTCRWPNKEVPCGKLAKWALMDLVIGINVTCRWHDQSQQLAICKAGGFDVARNLVHTGWAVADREQSLRYVVNEKEAKTAKRALWKGAFLPPKQWRAKNK